MQGNKTAIITGYLRDLVWRNKYISVDSNIRIGKPIVRPVSTYAEETRTGTSKREGMLRSIGLNGALKKWR